MCASCEAVLLLNATHRIEKVQNRNMVTMTHHSFTRMGIAENISQLKKLIELSLCII